MDEVLIKSHLQQVRLTAPNLSIGTSLQKILTVILTPDVIKFFHTMHFQEAKSSSFYHSDNF